MPNVCEVCGALEQEAEEQATPASGVCADNLHVCAACQQDRQSYRQQIEPR